MPRKVIVFDCGSISKEDYKEYIEKNDEYEIVSFENNVTDLCNKLKTDDIDVLLVDYYEQNLTKQELQEMAGDESFVMILLTDIDNSKQNALLKRFEIDLISCFDLKHSSKNDFIEHMNEMYDLKKHGTPEFPKWIILFLIIAAIILFVIRYLQLTGN